MLLGITYFPDFVQGKNFHSQVKNPVASRIAPHAKAIEAHNITVLRSPI